ncbi:MAG: tetratricopeptide repeat protein, partial [Anaerolineae bacterium]|nr:tetratricopeptide repeat protein [Anaerolineae bacterium]
EISDEVDQALVLRDLDTAQALASQALDADSENLGALYASAHVNLELYNLEEAEADAQRMLELAPEQALPFIALFDIYLETGRWDDAVEMIGNAAEVEPENPQVMWRQSIVSEWDVQSDLLNQAEAAGARGYRFIRYAGFYFADDLQLERALPYLDTALQGSNGGDYEARAYLMGVLVRLDRAVEALTLAQEIAPGQSDPTTLGEMAFIAWKAGDTAQAREWANRARALTSEAYAASWVLAWIIAEEDGDIATALTMMEEIEPAVDDEFYPRYMNPLYGYALPLDRARLLVLDGRLEEALDVYNLALENEPYEAQWYAERGDVLNELGDTEAARADYRRAADIALETGDNAFADEMLQRITDLGPAADSD